MQLAYFAWGCFAILSGERNALPMVATVILVSCRYRGAVQIGDLQPPLLNSAKRATRRTNRRGIQPPLP